MMKPGDKYKTKGKTALWNEGEIVTVEDKRVDNKCTGQPIVGKTGKTLCKMEGVGSLFFKGGELELVWSR